MSKVSIPIFVVTFLTLALGLWMLVGRPSGESQANSAGANGLRQMTDIGKSNVSMNDSMDDPIQKVILRTKLEKEGRALAEKGNLNEAIAKYQESIVPELINYEHEKSTAMGAIMEIYKWQGKYDEALKYLQWFIETNANEENKPTTKDFEDEGIIEGILSARQTVPKEKREIEALRNARDLGSDEPIYDHLRYLERRYRNFLPPYGYNSYSTVIISDMIRLYDYVSDYEGGIAFVNRITNSPSLSEKEKTEYQKIIAAFEADRTAKTNGSATRVVVGSDYFTW